MKIAIVNQHVEEFLGGSESQCDNIAKGLTLKGYDIVYIAPKGTLTDYESSYKVISTPFCADHISQTILKENPDIVYWRFGLNHFYHASKVIHENKIPIIFAISNRNEIKPWLLKFSPGSGLRNLYNSVKNVMLRRIEYEGYKYVSGVTSLNPDYVGIIPVKKQAFIANSVTNEIKPFLWPRPFIAWVANIKQQKRPEVFIELSRSFSDRSIDFLMIGKLDSYMEDILNDETSTPGNFHYLGQKSIQEVNGILKESLFLVHTCKPEGFGNIYIQAWMQKKPTISFEFDPGGYIKKNKIGEVADANFDLLVKHVSNYLINDNQRTEAGYRAYEFANKNFSIPKTVNQLERFILSILDKNNTI